MRFTATARGLGIVSATASVVLLVAYAATLAVGLASLESPRQPIGDPMFAVLKFLITLVMPAMFALMATVHAWAPTDAKTLSLAFIVYMALLAGLTCSVHFSILMLSRQPELAGRE
jgi:Ca2+/Na+ antiporter